MIKLDNITEGKAGEVYLGGIGTYVRSYSSISPLSWNKSTSPGARHLVLWKSFQPTNNTGTMNIMRYLFATPLSVDSPRIVDQGDIRK